MMIMVLVMVAGDGRTGEHTKYNNVAFAVCTLVAFYSVNATGITGNANIMCVRT